MKVPHDVPYVNSAVLASIARRRNGAPLGDESSDVSQRSGRSGAPTSGGCITNDMFCVRRQWFEHDVETQEYSDYE